MGTLDRLRVASKEALQCRTEADNAEDSRDTLIRVARTEGATVTQIAEASRLSPPRIYQILKGTP